MARSEEQAETTILGLEENLRVKSEAIVEIESLTARILELEAFEQESSELRSQLAKKDFEISDLKESS